MRWSHAHVVVAAASRGMHRRALVLTLLAACATKPAPAAPTPASEPAYEEPYRAPAAEPAPVQPGVDQGCYDECMMYTDDHDGCAAACTPTGDYSYDDCMDACMADLADWGACDAECY